MVIPIAGYLAICHSVNAAPLSPFQGGASATSYEYDRYYAQESAGLSSDSSAAPTDETGASRDTAGEKDGCGERSCCSAAAADATTPEMFHLFECCSSKRMRLNIGGWTAKALPGIRRIPSTGLTDLSPGLIRRISINSTNNGFTLNDRPIRAAMGGTLADVWTSITARTARFDTEAGLENRVNTPNNPYMALALQQFYGELAYNRLKIKFGHFLSPVGYFVVPTPNNFFNTLPYTFQYGEPFTHTGMLATWTANDHWVLGGGLIRGWDNWSSANPNLGSLATATWTGEKKDTLSWVWVQSHEPNSVSGGRRHRREVVSTRPGSCKLWSIPALSPTNGRGLYKATWVCKRGGRRTRRLGQDGTLVRLEPILVLQGQRFMDLGRQLRMVSRRGRIPRRQPDAVGVQSQLQLVG